MYTEPKSVCYGTFLATLLLIVNQHCDGNNLLWLCCESNPRCNLCVCTLLGECLWWEGKCCHHKVLALSESECQWIVTHVSASLLRELEAGKLCHQLNMMWKRKNHYVWLYLYNGYGWVGKCCLVVQAVWVQIQISLVNVYRYLQPLPCLWEEYKYNFHEVKWKRVTLS